MIPDAIKIALIMGVAMVSLFGFGLYIGWKMGKRLNRSVVAAIPGLYYDDSKKKIDDTEFSTHDDGRELFHDAHITESIPKRIDTLDSEKK